MRPSIMRLPRSAQEFLKIPFRDAPGAKVVHPFSNKFLEPAKSLSQFQQIGGGRLP
jgi:hypothetical protein